MNEEKFNEAKGNLAFSQGLMDRLNAQNMSQKQGEMEDMPQKPIGQPQDMAPEAPVSPQEASQQPDIAQAVQEAMTPFMDEIRALIEKQGEETKEVEVKIAGELSPKEEEDPVAKTERGEQN